MQLTLHFSGRCKPGQAYLESLENLSAISASYTQYTLMTPKWGHTPSMAFHEKGTDRQTVWASINAYVLLSWDLSLVLEAKEDPFQPLKEFELKLLSCGGIHALSKHVSELQTPIHLSCIFWSSYTATIHSLQKEEALCLVASTKRALSASANVVYCLNQQEARCAQCLILYMLGAMACWLTDVWTRTFHLVCMLIPSHEW